ncbi:hypothetical protein B0H13DRAFT_2368927 [Mycena leptocephala]|nr:hypothetical protein B0H13DRAFT_2368927 [Mycena leptocephala]
MDTNQAQLKDLNDRAPADASENGDSDDDIPDLVPDDPISDHIMARQHSGLSANGPQCEAPSDLKKISTGDCWAHGVTSCLNVLRATFIAYDICYRLPMPIRSFVPAPPVLVSQCMACLPNNAHCRHEGNIYRRSEHRRGEYLAWEPCSGKNEGKAQPSCLPSQLVRAKM